MKQFVECVLEMFVEIAQRFVENENRWRLDYGPCEDCSLQLTARQGAYGLTATVG